MALSAPETLYFMHIPKTGGTTLISELRSHFPAQAICPYILVNQLMRATPEETAQYRLFYGHHFYPIDQLLGWKPSLITIVRDPIHWVVSNYYYIVRSPEHHYHSVFKAKSLTEFVSDPELRLLVQNYQTRFIAATPDLRRTAELLRSLGQTDLQAETAIIDKMNWFVSEDTMLNIAKQRLDTFAFVGITEHLNTAILLLDFLFGWKPLKELTSLNVAPDYPDIDRHTLSAIHDLMPLDLELYKYASQLYEKKAQETILAMLEQIENQKSNYQQFYEQVIELQNQLEHQEQQLAHFHQIEDGWAWKLISGLRREQHRTRRR